MPGERSQALSLGWLSFRWKKFELYDMIRLTLQNQIGANGFLSESTSIVEKNRTKRPLSIPR